MSEFTKLKINMFNNMHIYRQFVYQSANIIHPVDKKCGND